MNDETKAYLKTHLEELRLLSVQLVVMNGLLDKLPNKEDLSFGSLSEAQSYIKQAKSNIEDGIEVLQDMVYGEVS